MPVSDPLPVATNRVRVAAVYGPPIMNQRRSQVRAEGEYMDNRMQEDDPKLIAWYEQHKGTNDLKALNILIRELGKLGWKVHSVYDGEYYYARPSLRFVRMIASNLDDYSIRFQKVPGAEWHSVWMVNGNDEICGVVADYEFLDGDADGFKRDMDVVTEHMERW